MSSENRKRYHQHRLKRIVISLALILAIFIIAVYSLCINDFPVSFEEAIKAISDRLNGIEPSTYIDRMIDNVVIEDNAPRAIAAVLIGIILAFSGAVMQTVTHNPLAEPYTIGISSAALFGVTLAIILGVSFVPGLSGNDAAMVNAFIFAMIPAMAIVTISSMKKISPNMMILVGIGMMYMFSAVTTFLKFNASEEDLQEIYIWGLGTFDMIGWDAIIPLLIAALMIFIGFMVLSGRINLLMAGDNVCQTLGVNPIQTRIVCFVLVSVGVAVAVCYTGTIGFVGLVAPHIARLITGNNNKILLPVSALTGTLLILVSETIVRTLPGGMPMGVITALIGSPIFLYFLFKQRRKSTF